ncbi:single stranded DNA-binding protein (ssb) [Pricia antarctica]|uniref:Single-stranded DNA-binding protein n=2 Tax=Pricia antarctica TaxID=641691 RepID=A0A1G6X935_9FLAO|nr:single stranded DNA-binding protein (ssb) [Pricia antarctica]
MGSRSKTGTMKSYRILKNEAEQKLKNKKKENAPDIISKSVFNACAMVVRVPYKSLNILIMSTLRNKVQLIGNVGNEPETTVLESGKKVTRFSLATNENYRNDKGEKVQTTDWHNIVAWGKTAEIIEQYAGKGKQIAVEGKLTSRNYETKEGEKRYITEVVVNELVLLGFKGDSEKAA